MTDIVSPAKRSQMMSGIRAKDSRPEMVVRRLLHSAGYRFRLHRGDLPGTPDIVLPGSKIAIFVHGCFWHMHKDCRLAKIPGTHPDFWTSKLQANVARDNLAVEKLIADGWRVLCIWECATRGSNVNAALLTSIERWMDSMASFGEVCENRNK